MKDFAFHYKVKLPSVVFFSSPTDG